MKKTSIWYPCLITLGMACFSLRTQAEKPAVSDNAAMEAAKEHYKKGAALYEENKYDEALGEFEAAKKMTGKAALDYNIAKCLEHLGMLGEAVAAYEHYLHGTPPPSPEDVPDVQKRINELRELERMQQATEKRLRTAPITAPPATAKPVLVPTVPTPPPIPARPNPFKRYRYPLIVGGGALVLFGTFAALEGSAISSFHDLQGQHNTCRTCDLTAGISDLKLREALGYTALALGAAAVVVTGVLALIEWRKGR